jgi:hypothetical protein
MSSEFSEEVQQELARIAELGTDEQVAAYRALHELLEATLNESN